MQIDATDVLIGGQIVYYPYVPRSAGAILADIKACQARLDALKAELINAEETPSSGWTDSTTGWVK